jgi:hypothetical protein
MIIFGRWSLWMWVALGVLVIAAALAAQHPVIVIALVAVTAILAVSWWRNGSRP